MSRLISIILVLAIFLAFIVLNIDNKSDISFGFKKATDIPVYISVLFAFLLGMVFALPFSFSLFMRLKKSSKAEHHDAEPAAGRKKFWGRNKNKDADGSAVAEDAKKDSGPYGID